MKQRCELHGTTHLLFYKVYQARWKYVTAINHISVIYLFLTDMNGVVSTSSRTALHRSGIRALGLTVVFAVQLVATDYL